MRGLAHPHRSHRPPRRLLAALATAVAAVLVYVLTMLPAPAATPHAAQADVVGNATHFDGLGQPYGGCGMPQSQLDSPDFVALNVFNTPGDYGSHPRPVPAAQSSIVGAWDNGHNCGRWVRVTIGDYCTGTNDGAAGQPFCRNGGWTQDSYNGATLTMLVADSCADTNAWCRDDPNHLDLDTASLGHFTQNGTAVTGLADHWNNRHVSWSYVPAPGYTGDIKIGFLQGAQRYWGAVSVSHLPNGVHGVEFYSGGAWHEAQMNSDMGQSFILDPTTDGGTDFRIRVRDVDDSYVFGGRTYDFSLPAACSGTCSQPYTGVDYTTGGGSTTPTTTPATTPPTTPPTSPTSTPPTSSGAGGCAAAVHVSNSWPGGYQADVTVRNTGTRQTTGWAVRLALPQGVTIGSVWNAAADASAPATTLRNVAYNGTLAPSASTSWGMTLSGTDQSLGTPSCTASG
ncbi:cellulose binding domain-containing protein [Streptomyces sp. NBC_01198]|uniref:cellulose binding domain-containing protein n=1 Tax=Streptomyces sp. NBC_01198 TaxID=2903769 RepID=UPI002E0E6F84|nr:cellulose binding domain-containing protein [Streptomyces sp. NBC_01198]